MDARVLCISSAGLAAASILWWLKRSRSRETRNVAGPSAEVKHAILPCIRARRSVFPRDYIDEKIDASIVRCLLEAAMWAPHHGPLPPWRFVVLGGEAMVTMQKLTLAFYDQNWQRTGWGSGERGSEAQYQKWRAMTEEEISGRWGPVSYMIAIIMRRQAHPEKLLPEWEEAAATACAVQNMYIQASAFPGLACYWSSWHDAARDSLEMQEFLGMQMEDKCLGFFMVAACRDDLRDRRQRRLADMAIEWRD
eukprot:TRINITY_DN74730_c0_g1_i1.p1 TRINITY_DN74730_c0_g1~~TRINITY_DN74730_c0_g1_i1.p1  ORF type:complete len:251 (+),score=31.97 TRINITY_DN74730_c0_g1_i1:84-836(+)